MRTRYYCVDCGYKVYGKVKMICHMRVHTGEKPYECDKCDSKFALKHNLTTHRTIHTGEKPYGCTKCEKKFRVSSSLKNHMEKIHNKRIGHITTIIKPV